MTDDKFRCSVKPATEDMLCEMEHVQGDRPSWDTVLLITWYRSEGEGILRTMVLCRPHVAELMQLINSVINFYPVSQPGGEHGPR